jgi:hypothetical protein
VQKDVAQGPSILFDKISVPTLSFTFQQADYVQILRCAASFKFKTQDGTLVENVLHIPSNQADLKWAWTLAWNQKDACEVVTDMASAVTYPDITVPTGRFYYIINPCVSKIHSMNNRDTCSYLVETTNAFSYTNIFQEELRRKAIDMSKSESSLRAFMDQVKILSSTLSLSIQNCQNYVAQHDSLQKLRLGLAEFGIFVGLCVIGFALGGGLMVLFWANMGAMIGHMFMVQFKAFEEAGNYCISQTKPGENDFGIHAAYNQLRTVLNVSIPTAQKQMENLMDEMNKYDSRVLNYNQALQKFKTLTGVDLDSPTSVQDAVSNTVKTGSLPGN